MKRTRLSVLAATLTAGSLLLAGCGGAGAADATTEEMLALPAVDDANGLVVDGEQVADASLLEAARDDTLVWFTGSGSESAELTADRFTAETGVEVEVTRMPSAKLNERVPSEAGAGRLSAGVVTVTDPMIAEGLEDNGVYVPYTEMPTHDTLAGTKDVQWADGAYYTSYYSAYAFAYNTQAVDAAAVPTSWDDLLDPRWKGRMGVVNAGAGGTVQGLAAFQEQVMGPDYWGGLAAQDPRFFDTTSVQLESLARGEIDIATAGFNSTYGAELSGAPIKLVVPEEGVSGTFNMQGLTSAGQDSPAAKLFMNWTWSKSGQQFAAAQGFIGARTDIEQWPTGQYRLPKADDPSFVVYSPQEAAAQGADVVRRWNAAFGFNG
ncbi:iron(III) transport system substrate-binding protein [Pseudonocardia ammonioxydans]|uniref:Iron(III) transport system substrate-binding protein n=1 Tax=Pseudonocardia ammonioxydans TaxID=260086 RepID=A0A1I5AQU5_PSUAM|nr:extracellular solute-binding protein [Pseudonocardia ammonioxydans]SFN64916.1 iron(III) transport system substrate-binding protein [Pseudonocardia ammonioxydans]